MSGESCSSNEIVKVITNRLLELVMVEINKSTMQENIKTKIVHPLLFMIYKEFYPYLYGFIAIILLMFIMLVVLLVYFIIYLKK